LLQPSQDARGTTRLPAGWLPCPTTYQPKLAAAGLITERSSAVLGLFLADYIRGGHDIKPLTLEHLHRIKTDLVEHFGGEKPLRDITPGDADEFRLFLIGKRLAENTLRRRCGRAKQFFTVAVRRQLIPINPFTDLKSAIWANPSRFYFVSREETGKVIDACPDAQWRLLVALSRYGGLRCPSEHLALRWADVHWGEGRVTVRSPKTEHHAGGESRVIPLFPELRPHLEEAFEQAETGAEYVITRYRQANSNLRTQFERIIHTASLTPWPKLFQNMRSTRETELAKSFPMHVVCQWIGNSQPVAAKHYLQVTDAHFASAAQNPAQYTSITVGKGSYKKQQTPAIPEKYRGLPLCTDVQDPSRGDAGARCSTHRPAL